MFLIGSQNSRITKYQSNKTPKKQQLENKKQRKTSNIVKKKENAENQKQNNILKHKQTKLKLKSRTRNLIEKQMFTFFYKPKTLELQRKQWLS